jgi:hypothetical protein
LAAGAYLKTEPVTDACRGRLPQFRLGHVACGRSVHIDIDGFSHTEITRQERCRPFHHPTLVHEIQALEEAIVCHLAL